MALFTTTLPGIKDAKVIYFSGSEALSTLYSFQVSVITNKRVSIKHMLNEHITINAKSKNTKREFCGIATFIQEETFSFPTDAKSFIYHIIIQPSVWSMNLNKKYAIFENQSVENIIKTILEQNKINDSNIKLNTTGKEKRPYTVQYNESDLAFIQRLLADIGAYYYFSHQSSKDKINFISDSKDAYLLSKTYKTLNVQDFFNVFKKISNVTQSPHPDTKYISRNFTSSSFNIEHGTGEITSIKTSPFMEDSTSKEALSSLAKDNSEHIQITASSFIPELFSGVLLSKLGDEKEMLITKIEHKYSNRGISFVEKEDVEQQTLRAYNFDLKGQSYSNFLNYDDSSYENNLSAQSKDSPFKTSFKNIEIAGPTLGIVVGPDGKTTHEKQEVYTDKYGRIRVRFMWQNKLDDHTSPVSCWIRVSQTLTGSSKAGTLFLPHIGNEVIISFINGDPNNPIITGSLFNAQNMPPYLPDNANRNTIKTFSIGGKKSDDVSYNELRFENTFEKEEIFFHAAKDYNEEIENSHIETVKDGDKTATINKGSYNTILKSEGDKASNVQLSVEKGDISTEIKQKGNLSYEIHNGDIKTTNHKGNLTTHIDDGNITNAISQGNYKIDLTRGNYELSITNGNQTIDITGAQNINIKQGQKTSILGEMEQNITGGMKITTIGPAEITSESELSLKSMGMLSIEGMAGVDIKTMGELSVNGSAININAAVALSATVTCLNVDVAAAMSVTAAGLATFNVAGAFAVNAPLITLTGGMVTAGAAVAIG